MEIWGAINDTLSIIAWPAVAVAAVGLFRGQISKLIGRVRELEAFGAKLRAEQQVERATSEYADRVRDVVKGPVIEAIEVPASQLDHTAGREVDGQQPLAIEGNGEVVAPSAEVIGRGHVADSEESRFSRPQVEEFIKAAGVAGYEIGVTGTFEGVVEPAVRWTDDNVPEIDHWEGTPGAPDQVLHGETDRVRRLEEEIKQLTFQTNSPFMPSVSMMISGKQATLMKLKEKLKRLDPNSPWTD